MNNHEIALAAIELCADFNSFSKEEKSMLAAIAQVVDYEKGTKIFSMDQADDRQFYIIHSGKLALTLKGKRGIGKELTKGQLFGEIAIFSEKYRLGTIECLDSSVLIVFNRDKILNRELLSAQVALKICIALTKKITQYFYADDHINTQELVSLGEGETIEFKRSLNESKLKIVETITAFMNLRGGVILIGIEDDGKVKGIILPEDKTLLNQKRDEYWRMILDTAKTRIDKYFLDLIKVDWDNVDGRNVMRIDCYSAESPVFFKEFVGLEEKEYYIVRTGGENIKLVKTSEITSHIIKKFKH